MKVRIESRETKLTLWFPTSLAFSRGTVWLADHFGRKYAGEAMENVPREAMDALFAEFRRIKKQYGTWELADIESADGD